MTSHFLKRLLADGLVVTDDAVDAHRTDILAHGHAMLAAAAANVKKTAGDAIGAADLGFFGNRMKGTLVTGLGQAVDKAVADLTVDEDAWLAQLVAAGRQYALSLSSSGTAPAPSVST